MTKDTVEQEGAVKLLKVDVVFTRELLGSVPLNTELYGGYIQDKAIKLGLIEAPKVEAEIVGVENAKEAVEEMEAKGQTGFLMFDGKPHLSSHVVLGMFKEKMALLRYAGSKRANAVSAYKRKIDLLCYVFEDFIELVLPKVLQVPVYSEAGNPLHTQEMVLAKEKWQAELDVLEADGELELDTDRSEKFLEFLGWYQPPVIRDIVGYKFRSAGQGVNERPLRADTPQGPRVALASSITCDAGTRMQFHMEVRGSYANKLLLDEIFAECEKHGFGQWRSAKKGTAKMTYEVIDSIPDPIYHPAELPAL